MRRAIVAVTVLVVSVGLARAGTRADLSGDAVVNFATTMDMPMMNVGNVGNAADTRYESPGYGGVDYAYRIGKFEVTAGQYTEFLNAVAATDTYGLYNEAMNFVDNGSDFGCDIRRTGSAGSYSYSVASDWADRPVNYVSWGDAARFSNWLTNGMPTGGQDLTTTEDGSYFLDGATTEAQLLAVTRKSPEDGGRYYIPTEDEWYKAAYHKNDGVTGNYFNYPTGTDTRPEYIGDGESITDPDPGNYATYDGDKGIDGIGSPYYRTEVGEHENSESPYDTFDMGGNIYEWNEAILHEYYRGLRGGCFDNTNHNVMHAYWGRADDHPTDEVGGIGFRVSEVPEPGSAALMLIVGGCLVRRKRRRVA